MGKPGSTVRGDDGNNLLYGTRYDDFIYGFGGDDEIHAGAGDDQVQAHEGNDRIYGEDGNDRLYGGFGDDLIDGGAGNDTLFGGTGADAQTGGAGADIFAFVQRWDSTGGAVPSDLGTGGIDLITDFASGIDKIDLTRIDADERTVPGAITGNKTPGNEAFTIVSSSDGVTPGQLVISTGIDEFGRPITIITGYTDTVAGADFEIHLLGTGANGEAIVGPQDFWL